jgi:FMN phosphatase YigB (HAD superfamily)
MRGWIGVDLDGTLAHYDGWKDGAVGPPIPLMQARVKEWLAAGVEVRIVTARVSVPQGLGQEAAYERMKDIKRQRELIGAWCEEHLGQRLAVTNQKDFAMIELWDDRCVQVEANTGRRMDGFP